MTRGLLNRMWAVGLLVGGCTALLSPAPAGAQTDQGAAAQLLEKAHALEVRDRMDMARQVWQQVLLGDPNNAEALAGMARAAKLEGHPRDAEEYLNRLRAVNPNDPNIQRIETMGTARDQSGRLQEAGRLAQAGQYARAMGILREVYGTNPPPGDAALSYYQTEAATEEGRPHAIAGLRALVDKYPQDSRYQIALGKILTYNPRTRAEGRKLLEKHPADGEAQEALRQSLVWDSQNPGSAPDIRAYLQHHPDQQLQRALSATQAQQRRSGGGRAAAPQTPEQQAAQAATRARNAEQQAAYNALNAKRIDDADTRFKALLAKNPQDAQSLAGLGYVRMNQSNFGGAISFFEQAQQDGDKDPAVERVLHDSRFYYTMQTATTALNENQLPYAEQQFRAALGMRPNDPTALLGLGGTLLKGQQNEPAVSVFTTYVKVAPGDNAAWRGLFMAQYGAGRYGDALATEHRIPPAVRARLLRDPDYLRTLASVYLALGRDADAQRVLRGALDLPFPAGGTGLKADVQLQYAALLSTANHKQQAIGLYQQVLAADPNNSNAWVGLVQNEHQLGNDSGAYEAVRSMPPDVYAKAMQEAGFETTVAAVYEGQGHDDLAQDVLEKFLAGQQAAGKKPFVPAQVQLAGIYMRRGDSAHAYPLYRSILENNPNSAEAWNGLLGSLHSTGHDREALAQLQQIPPAVRKDLESNPQYLQTVGSIYAGLGESQQAMLFFARVQQHYAAQHVAAPADVDVQEAWLLYNSHADQALVRQLLALGSRQDLTDPQRLTVQTIWANEAVRKANQASAAGDPRRALAILNAAAQAFPNNPQVVRALASGYGSAGMPGEAVKIFRAQNLNTASAADYEAAVGAALSANDLRDAETWLRFGLDQYPRDPQMLMLAARFETARGDPNRAAEYYRAALSAMPASNTGAQLATELAQPAPATMDSMPRRGQSQDLATLLSQPDVAGQPAMQQPVAMHPYLPSYGGNAGSVPVPMDGSAPMYPAVQGNGPGMLPPGGGASSGYMYGGSGVMGTTGAPDLGGYPTQTQQSQPAQGGAKGSHTLKDYSPQSHLDAPTMGAGTGLRTASSALHLHADRHLEAKFGPYIVYNPSNGVPQFAGSHNGFGDGLVLSGSAVRDITTTARSVPAVVRATKGDVVHYAEVRFVQQQQAQQEQAAPAVSPRPRPARVLKAADGTPILQYAPAARPAPAQAAAAPQHRRVVTRTPSASVQAQAAAIHANQETAPALMTGVSHPPVDSYQTTTGAELNNAQFQPYGAQAGQTTQPATPPSRGTSTPYPAATPQGAYPGAYGQTGGSSVLQTGDSTGQQYPQPNTRGTTAGTGTATSGSAPRRRRTRASTTPATTSAAVEAEPAQQPVTAPAMNYPSVGQSLENPGYPQVGSPYPLGQAPTDYDLRQRNLPPLRAYTYDSRADTHTPLSPRQQAEFDLAQIEGSYSGWLGGSVIGRFRSGTSGIDRLASLEVPFEASFVFNNSFRLSIIPKAVFLNSGQLDTTSGALGTGPVLGTLAGTTTVAPTQQFASGVGGEVQIATNTFAAAVGFTPYQFLVSNVIGRVRWRPGNYHFTLFGGRDPVRETQLSYAGLRDPGSATATYGGNVWGGVVEIGGGVRFDFGDAKSGLYVQGEGSTLTGYHVLQNNKFDGIMGAYFQVKQWPEYGTLNIGGALLGEHFEYNERGETYGLGGYFSPEAYFLAAVPVTFNGHYGTDLHYTINGAVGVQTFQEDNQVYYPLDPALLSTTGCTVAQLTARTCGLPVNANTGLNFSIDTEISYRVNDHWFVGGFLSANNTNNYNTVSGGFFARYTFRPQYPSVDYPTGLFPVEGFRPLRVP